MLGTSVAENVTAIIDMLRYGVDSDSVEAPMAAVEYARRLAQHGVEPRSCVPTGSDRRGSPACWSAR